MRIFVCGSKIIKTHEQKNHIADCCFFSIDARAFIAKNEQNISYLNISSAFHQLPHKLEIPVSHLLSRLNDVQNDPEDEDTLPIKDEFS